MQALKPFGTSENPRRFEDSGLSQDVFEDRTTTTENICRYEGIERYLCFS
jgi:hypothetical protein